MANWTAVWTTATGALVSVGTVVSVRATQSITDLGVPDTQPDPSIGKVWNTTTHVFDTPAARKAVLSPQAFWDRWTVAERQSFQCYTSTGRANPPVQTGVLTPTVQMVQVQEFQSYVHDALIVDCNTQYVQDSVNFCETINVLAAGRAAVIMA